MAASMLEIYNEDYKDLLARKKLPDGKQHKVRLTKCDCGCGLRKASCSSLSPFTTPG